MQSRPNGLIIPDGFSMRGDILFELKNVRTGHVDRIHRHNLITTDHRELVASWLAGDAPAAPDYIALGTGAQTQYAESNQDALIDLASTGADQQLAQGFQISAARNVNAVLLYLRRIGTSPGSLTLEIQSDSSGDPSGTVLGTSDTFAFNTVETSLGWVRFEFASPVALLATTQYHWVLRSSGYTYSNGVTEVAMGVDQSAPGYTDGQVKTYNGTVWSAFGTASDAIFRVTVNPTVSFDVIIDEITRKQLTSKTTQSATSARLLANFTTAQANGRHGMAGLLNAASGGTLSAAAAIDVTKTNQQALNVYWIISVN